MLTSLSLKSTGVPFKEIKGWLIFCSPEMRSFLASASDKKRLQVPGYRAGVIAAVCI